MVSGDFVDLTWATTLWILELLGVCRVLLPFCWVQPHKFSTASLHKKLDDIGGSSEKKYPREVPMVWLYMISPFNDSKIPKIKSSDWCPSFPNDFLRLGVTSMCLGSGMGAASVIELEWGAWPLDVPRLTPLEHERGRPWNTMVGWWLKLGDPIFSASKA